MKTYYKPSITSSNQSLKRNSFSARERKNPANEEIEKFNGSFDINVTFEQDLATLALLKHVPGVVAFLCTLKKNGKIISQGRGSAVLNRMNRFIERPVNLAFGAAFVDAAVRCARVLDTLRHNVNKPNTNIVIDEEYEKKESISELATERQKSYLLELISVNVTDEDERNRWESRIDELTKDEASEAIQSFKR